MSSGSLLLPLTAAALGAGHTVLGPDHWAPFIVLGRVRRWSLGRTLALTLTCGVGHVASSLVLALIGIGAGWAVTDLAAAENFRGSLAGWLLLGFGLVYLVWGLRRGLADRWDADRWDADRWDADRWDISPHGHAGRHGHHHTHAATDARDRSAAEDRPLTSWVLFFVFVFGPCEPLIPLLMVPAAQGDAAGGLWAAAAFTAATLTVMLLFVGLGATAADRLEGLRFERWSHALAGAALTACGVAVQLGL